MSEWDIFEVIVFHIMCYLSNVIDMRCRKRSVYWIRKQKQNTISLDFCHISRSLSYHASSPSLYLAVRYSLISPLQCFPLVTFHPTMELGCQCALRTMRIFRFWYCYSYLRSLYCCLQTLQFSVYTNTRVRRSKKCVYVLFKRFQGKKLFFFASEKHFDNLYSVWIQLGLQFISSKVVISSLFSHLLYISVMKAPFT